MLLAKKCDLRAKDRSGDTALSPAWYSSSTQCVSLILDQEPETSRRLLAATATTIVMRIGDFQTGKYLLMVAGDTPEITKQSLLIIQNASQRDDYEMAKSIIPKGANINAKNDS